MRVRIKTHEKFKAEKEYVFSVLFRDMLGWEYDIETGPFDDFLIILPNSSKLHLPDNFFGLLENNSGNYDPDILPSDFVEMDEPVFLRSKIHTFYGNPLLELEDREASFGWDVFGCIYYCLARVEEISLKDVDEHGRFPLEKSTSFQKGFYQYPLVNYLAELIGQVCRRLDPELQISESDFEVFPTIDIDHPFKYLGLKGSVKFLRDYLKGDTQKKETRGDPFFERTMELVRQLNELGYAPWVFYLIGEYGNGKKELGGERLKAVKNVIASLADLDYIPGLHPGYPIMEEGLPGFIREKAKLEELLSSDVFCSRMHYLRSTFPDTFRDAKNAGLSQDFSLGFSKKPGFRAGICRPYMLFDPLKKEPIGLLENPLMLMDRSYLDGNPIDEAEINAEVMRIYDETKRFGGKLSLLIHNSTYKEPGGRFVNDLFLELCRLAKEADS